MQDSSNRLSLSLSLSRGRPSRSGYMGLRALRGPNFIHTHAHAHSSAYGDTTDSRAPAATPPTHTCGTNHSSERLRRRHRKAIFNMYLSKSLPDMASGLAPLQLDASFFILPRKSSSRRQQVFLGLSLEKDWRSNMMCSSPWCLGLIFHM